MLEKTYLEYVDAIQTAQADAEIDVLSALTSAYVKQAYMLQECDQDYMASEIVQEGEIMDAAKGNSSENLLKRILLFIPRLLKALWTKVFKSQKTKEIKTLSSKIINKFEYEKFEPEKFEPKKLGDTSSANYKVTYTARVDIMNQGLDKMYNDMVNPEELAKFVQALMTFDITGTDTNDMSGSKDRESNAIVDITDSGSVVIESLKKFCDQFQSMKPKKFTYDVRQVIAVLKEVEDSAITYSPDNVRDFFKNVARATYQGTKMVTEMVQKAVAELEKRAKNTGSSQQDAFRQIRLTNAAKTISEFLQVFTVYSSMAVNETLSVVRQIYKQIFGDAQSLETKNLAEPTAPATTNTTSSASSTKKSKESSDSIYASPDIIPSKTTSLFDDVKGDKSKKG